MGKTWKDGKHRSNDFGGKPKRNPKSKRNKSQQWDKGDWQREKDFDGRNWSNDSER